MRINPTYTLLGTSGIACFTLFTAPLQAEPRVNAELSIEFFYDELEPHGHWVSVEEYGWVWTPEVAPPEWRPYTMGRWEYTEEHGWLWASEWEWGWAPFHYGRWVSHAHHGWVWVPGTEWGPAWVAWRSGKGHVGWAPLPPAATWDVNVGLRLNAFDLSVSIHESSWSFVEERYILRPRLYKHCVHHKRNVTLLRTTVDSTRYVVLNGQIANTSLSVKYVEKMLGRAVPRRTVHSYDSPASPRRIALKGSEIKIFKPKFSKRAPRRAPRSVASHGHKSAKKTLGVSGTTSPHTGKLHPGSKRSVQNPGHGARTAKPAGTRSDSEHRRSKIRKPHSGAKRGEHDRQESEQQKRQRKGKARGSKSKKP